MKTFFLASLAVSSAAAAGLRAGEGRRARAGALLEARAALASTVFAPVVDDLAAGSPAESIVIKTDHLLDTLKDRYASVTLTCAADKTAMLKSSKVGLAKQEAVAAQERVEKERACMVGGNTTVHRQEHEIRDLMSRLVEPRVYDKLRYEQGNLTMKLNNLTAKHEVREQKYRDETEEHNRAHGVLNDVLEIVQTFYTEKGQAPPHPVESSMADAEMASAEQVEAEAVREPAAAKEETEAKNAETATATSLLEASIRAGNRQRSLATVAKMLHAASATAAQQQQKKEEPATTVDAETLVEKQQIKDMMKDTHQGEDAKTDSPKKQKVAGTLWKALWMMKNTMMNDTAVMHERHQLHQDHTSGKMDALSAELADVEDRAKAFREGDLDIKAQVDKAMAIADKAQQDISTCKERFVRYHAEFEQAEALFASKQGKLDKMDRLCKTQLAHIEDEIHLGRYVIDVIQATVNKLNTQVAGDGDGTLATGPAAATATGPGSSGLATGPVEQADEAATGP